MSNSEKQIQSVQGLKESAQNLKRDAQSLGYTLLVICSLLGGAIFFWVAKASAVSHSLDAMVFIGLILGLLSFIVSFCAVPCLESRARKETKRLGLRTNNPPFQEDFKSLWHKHKDKATPEHVKKMEYIFGVWKSGHISQQDALEIYEMTHLLINHEDATQEHAKEKREQANEQAKKKN